MRIVIKIGTNVLLGEKGVLEKSRFENMAKDIALLIREGHEVVLVTSGAVAAGRSEHVLVKSRKVLAAMGQPILMNLYAHAFATYGLKIGQALISRADIANRELYGNAVRVIREFLTDKIIPVLNENDVFADESLNFGDNDSLAAMIAVAISADCLLLLTNQPGLLAGDPKKKTHADLIRVVTRVDKEIERLCSKEASASGRGGMIRKVKAAQQAVFAGITTFIADGRKENIISKIFNGEPVGTRFIACKIDDLTEQKRWLLSAKGFGQVIIDPGAAAALKRGKSLLFPGVVAIRGLFEPDSVVEVVSQGEIIAFGRIHFSEKQMQKALNLKEKKADYKQIIDSEVIHSNYMIILKSEK